MRKILCNIITQSDFREIQLCKIIHETLRFDGKNPIFWKHMGYNTPNCRIIPKKEARGVCPCGKKNGKPYLKRRR
jgi:hypothetical protein